MPCRQSAANFLIPSCKNKKIGLMQSPPLPRFSTKNPRKWKSKNREPWVASVPRSAVSNCTANASHMVANAQKTVGVLAAVISQAVRRKFWKRRCWPTIGIQEPSRKSQSMCQFGSAHVRNQGARRSTVSALVQVRSAHNFASADTVRMGIQR